MLNTTFPVTSSTGILPFLSPCVLPLVPVYLANIAGMSILTSAPQSRRYIVLHTVSFVAGFSLVFTALGAASRYLRWLSRHAFATLAVSATLLISVGILMLTGRLAYISSL